MLKTKSVALAMSFLGMAVAACGAAPDAPGEVTQSSDQAITHDTAAPSCAYSYVAAWAPSEGSNVKVSCSGNYGLAAWAAVPESGACRPIKTQTGFWSATTVSDDPVEDGWYEIMPTCAQVGLPSDCCFYSWTAQKSGDLPDESALCAEMGSQKVLELGGCMACPDPPGTPAGVCSLPRPSSSPCPTCGFHAQ